MQKISAVNVHVCKMVTVKVFWGGLRPEKVGQWNWGNLYNAKI